jgi:CheY-like chemotaxis protein
MVFALHSCIHIFIVKRGILKTDVFDTDLSMPIMDGMTSTREIRRHEKKEKLRRVPVIALTGLAFNSTRLEAYESGMDHYLTKPVNFKMLEDVMGRGLCDTTAR